MPLNILLSKINWHRIVEKLFCFCVFLLASTVVAHAEDVQVKIEIGAITYSDVGFAVDVITTFDDMSLYNDQVYLSYHIVDEDGGEILFENQRVPFNPEAAYTTVYVECADLEELAGKSTAVVQFDLVDEGNVYWFSANSLIALDAAEVIFDREMLPPSIEQTQYANESQGAEASSTWVSNGVSAVFNIFVWIAVLTFLYFFKNRQILKRIGSNGDRVQSCRDSGKK